MSSTGDPGPPELPPEEELRRREAKVAIHGSPEVLALLGNLSGLISEFRGRALYLRAIRDVPVPSPANDWPAAWQEVESARAAFRTSLTTLLQRINAELRNE
jgi:hypothetical protein